MENRIMASLFFRRNWSKRPAGRRPSFVPRLENLEHRTVRSPLTVTNSNDVFSSNQAEHGGAITSVQDSVRNVLSSSFIANRAVGTIGDAYVEGGAIWITDNGGVGATATVIGCTFTRNQALGPNGGSLS